MSYRDDCNEARYQGLRAGDWAFTEGELYAILPNGDRFRSKLTGKSGCRWKLSGSLEAPTIAPSIVSDPPKGRLWQGSIISGKWVAD